MQAHRCRQRRRRVGGDPRCLDRRFPAPDARSLGGDEFVAVAVHRSAHAGQERHRRSGTDATVYRKQPSAATAGRTTAPPSRHWRESTHCGPRFFRLGRQKAVTERSPHARPKLVPRTCAVAMAVSAITLSGSTRRAVRASCNPSSTFAPIPADSAVETASTPNSWVGSVSAPAPRIDHAAVDWDRVPMEPDPSPLSVAGP